MINVSNISLIQEIRAIHALADLGLAINVEPTEEYKFRLLKDYFGVIYFNELMDDGLEISEILQIDHSKPLTSLLSVTKPLIFSKTITNDLKERWSKRRKYNFSFAGLITPEREKVIQNWMATICYRRIYLKKDTIAFKIKRKIFFKLNIKKPLIKKFGKLYIASTNKGRVFPIKSWDEEYFKFLLSSKFILCPAGAYNWTYRFYEAILCGAIPIVEYTCPSYEGFKYYHMEDDLNEIKWSKEIAESNFKLCVEKLTLSGEEMEEILKGIKKLVQNKS